MKSDFAGSELRRLLASIERGKDSCIIPAGETGIGDEELPPPEQPSNRATIADPASA
jgi:hypothetical protein